MFTNHLNICLVPEKKSSLFLLADLLGGKGGLSGKYIKTNTNRNVTTPNSERKAKKWS